MTTTSPPSHTLKIDYTNHSVQIVDNTSGCVAIYSHVRGRLDAITRLARDGWLLKPEGTWSYTWPPDGRQHPLIHRARPEMPVPEPLSLPQDTDDTTEVNRIVDHFGPGTSVIGVLTNDPHATIHRADLASPRRPHCGMKSHGVPAALTSAIGVLDDLAPDAATQLLTDLGLDDRRVCKRCWRPAWQIPLPDPQRRSDRHGDSTEPQQNRSAMFALQFTTDNAEFAGFSDADATGGAAETLRRVVDKLAVGQASGEVVDMSGNSIGHWGFELASAAEIDTLRSDLADLRHRIEEALGYLMSAPQHEYVSGAADILRGDD